MARRRFSTDTERKLYWRNRKRRQRQRWGAATAGEGWSRTLTREADKLLFEVERETARLPDPPRWQDAYSDEKNGNTSSAS